VIDDDESMRRGLARSLSSKFQVLLAADGMEGLRIFDENEIFSVILDVKMPGMNGFEVCTKLRQSEKPEVPVLFLTAFHEEHDLQAILNQFHPFAYLDKGGKYDLTANIDKAVQTYKSFKATQKRIKDLEKKLIEISVIPESQISLEPVDVPNIIGDEIIFDDSFGKIPVRDFNTFEIIGYIPDSSEEAIQRAIATLRKKQKDWEKKTILERNDVIGRAYQKLIKSTEWDIQIAKAGWFSPQVAREDILETARWVIMADDYQRWAFGKEKVDKDQIEGIGIVGIISTATMFHTGALPIKDSLSSGNAVLLKNDSRNPYPQFLFAKALWEEGAPIQVVSFDTQKRPYLGRKYMIDCTDKLIYMGHRKKALEMAYGETIQRYMVDTGATQEQVETFMKSLLMPGDDVMTFTAHIGADYVHFDRDPSISSKGKAHDAFIHPRACKRDAFSFNHPKIYNEELDNFIRESDRLVQKMKFVPVNGKYFDKFVKPYVLQGLQHGEMVYGNLSPDKPIIIEIRSDNLDDKQLIQLLGKECLGQVHFFMKSDEENAIRVGRKIADQQQKRKILEFSVYHSNQGIFDNFQKSRISCAFHDNEPTTRVFGERVFRRHEGRIFAYDTATVNHS
jgi:CheY-like chemotaxis protein